LFYSDAEDLHLFCPFLDYQTQDATLIQLQLFPQTTKNKEWPKQNISSQKLAFLKALILNTAIRSKMNLMAFNLATDYV
jgi:hypothetical protein